MEQKFRLDTRVFSDGKIQQDLFHEMNNARELMTSWIVNTRDQQIREALISLGWTPPKETKDGNV
jgi:hypothetical protein